MEKQQQDELFSRLIAEKKKEILSIPGVIDFGIGYKMKRGKLTKKIGITVVVKRKVKKLPKSHRIPKIILGVPVDVIVRNGELLAGEVDPDSKARPILGGLGICNAGTGIYGTLGAIVYTDDDTPCGLSNYHVLYGEHGDEGDDVVQPVDDDNATIGKLADGVSRLDCAIFKIDGSIQVDPQSLNGVDGTIDGIEDPAVGMKVLKAGAKTGVTYGVITHRFLNEMTIYIDSDHHGPNDDLADGGDSGAVYVTNADNGGLRAVGLQFKGERDSKGRMRRCYAKRMAKVAAKLGFKF